MRSSRVALVTGGSRGIGRAIASGLAEMGFDVAVGYRQDEEAASSALEMVRQLWREGAAIRADVRDPEAAAELVRETVSSLGRLDLLVSNAGSLASKPFLEVTPDSYDLQVETNARGSFFVIQAAAKHMIAHELHGKIILVTSDAAVRSYAGLSAYCMSKAAQRMLLEVAAKELAPYGITVNAIAPGTTETDLNREALKDPEQRDMLLDSILLARPGRPEDIAVAVQFLASDDNDFMTGSTVAVDGGAAIH